MSFVTVPFDIYLMYASVGAVCALVIAAILNRVRSTIYRETIDRPFCNVLVFFVAFCLVDAAWGFIGSEIILTDLAGKRLAYIISSYGFHFMAAVSALMCSYYVAHYVKMNDRWLKIMWVIRIAIFAVQIGFLFANIPTHLAFSIDENSVYHSTRLRYLSFVMQFCQYLPPLFYAMVQRIRYKGEEREAVLRLFRSAILYSSIPLAFGVLQMFYPDGAFYSLGFMSVSVVIYAFNIMAQREEYLAVFHVAKEQEKSHRQIQEALDRAEAANAAKSVFFANMSHDIRTPINGIMGMTALARHEEMTPRAAECLEKIDSASHHLLSLLNDVLDMSRIESGKTVIASEQMNLRTMIDNCNSIILGQLEGKGIDYVCKCDTLDHSRVLGDALHVRQILINILGNAVKFTPRGGSITFEVREVSCNDNSVVVSFGIRDTGIGMKPEFLDHIFEAFSQENDGARGNYQGTGLGMAICKQLVDLMNGTITVESKPGEGSYFLVTLPFILDHSPEVVRQESVPAAVEGELHVMLVEDNDLNMEIAQTMLENAGIRVTPAQNGKIAVDLFMKSEENSFDAILMDIMMPEMNGYDATRTIRAMRRADAATVPILAMTANAFDEDKRKAAEAGMNAHISKPIEFPVLLAELGRLTGSKHDAKS